jgi:hypothetical protein
LECFPRGVPLYTFRGFLHGSCLIKNLTSARSFPCEEKSTGPDVNFLENKKERKEKHGAFAYILRRLPIYNLNIKSTQAIDVPGVN